MPPQAGPYAVKNLKAVRFSLLDDTGSPQCPGDNFSAWSPCPQSLNTARQTSAAATTELRCGDGSIADSDTTPESVTGDQITIVLSKQEFETVALATGATPIMDPSAPTVVIGYLDPGTGDTPDPVEVNAWAVNRSGNANAAAPYSHLRLVWPYVQFRLGDDAVSQEYLTSTIIGTATPNGAIADGAFNDFPVSLNGRYRARWATTDVPDAADAPYSGAPQGGFLDTPACAS